MKIKNVTLKSKILLFLIVFIFSPFGSYLAQSSTEKEFTTSNYLPDKTQKETILAKVGDKSITVKEFYERAEYTIRPVYAKGDSELDKKIVLNSLIAEKLIALERGANSKIYNTDEYNQIITGRKEQVMRQLLFHDEGYAKVNIDSSEFVKEYKLAGRTYDVEFINFDFLEEAEYVVNQLKTDTISISQAYYQLTGEEKIPKHQIVWDSPEFEEISSLLFKNDVQINQLIGPIKLSDSYLVFKITGWTDRPAITETAQMQRYKNVNDKLRVEKGTKEYIKFIKKVMAGKKIEFDKDVFLKLVRIMAPLYNNRREESKENFAANNLDKKNDLDKKIFEIENNIADISDEALFTIDGQIWTVGMYEAERKKHPLVFGSKNVGGKKFAEQLKMAIVDLIHDKYLTEEAYKRKLDEVFITNRITNMWSDALLSFYEQVQIIKEERADKSFSYENVDKFFTPYIDELQEKYSSLIEINIEEFKNIKLTRIDFMALQKNVPYPIIVPPFPQITTDIHLEYGKKLKN